jgi:hypothetical protein
MCLLIPEGMRERNKSKKRSNGRKDRNSIVQKGAVQKRELGMKQTVVF